MLVTFNHIVQYILVAYFIPNSLSVLKDFFFLCFELYELLTPYWIYGF